MTEVHVGKTCPYCQSLIKPAAEVEVCPACQIPHHKECWETNGGCTTFACTGQPASAPAPPVATSSGTGRSSASCPECGSALSGAPTQCPACGAHLTTTATPTRGTGGSFFSRHLERILLVLGVLLLAGSAVLLYGLAQVNHGPGPTLYLGKTLGHLHLLPQYPSFYLGRPLDHSNPFVTIILLALTGVILVALVSAQRGRIPFIRRIPGLNAIDEAVGRATEMGRPILFSGGLAGVGIVSLQALAVASHIGRTAVRYGTRLIVPVCDPTMMPITEEVMREVYNSEGRPEAYRPEDIRYLSDRQFAYAAGVTGILHRERVAASFLFGMFYAESLILAENGQAVGAIQVAGTPDLLQTPFFVVTCDYTIIGDEYYAATAYLSREPTLLGSLTGQDIAKLLIMVIIVVGLVWTTFVPFDATENANIIYQWLGGRG